MSPIPVVSTPSQRLEANRKGKKMPISHRELVLSLRVFMSMPHAP